MMRQQNVGRLAVTAITALVLSFLYVPVLTLIILSFNNSVGISLPWAGFTMRWYLEALSNTGAFNAFGNSVKLGIGVGIVSTLIGLLAAVAFRRAIAGRSAVLASLLIPLLIPGVDHAAVDIHPDRPSCLHLPIRIPDHFSPPAPI